MKPLRLQPHLLTALLLAAMLGSGVPARAGAVSATTYYFAMSGNDANDGLSVTAPKRSLSLVPKLLAPGITVRLHRGDAWVAQDIAWDLSGLAGTAAEPMRIADYGDADQPRPVVSITPGRAGAFVLAKNTHHLTIANLDLRGGSAWRTARVEGDSRDVLFDNVSVARMAASAGRGAGPLTMIDGGGDPPPTGGGTYYYFSSTDGNNDFDGLSAATPKKSLALVPGLLQPGGGVYLKRGDTFYEPGLHWNFSNKLGTAATPMFVGAYGTASAKPIVANMAHLTAWTQVPGQPDLYQAAQVPASTVDRVFRVYIDGVNAPRDNGLLSDGSYKVEPSGTITLRYHNLLAGTHVVEVIANTSESYWQTFIEGSNVAYLTLANLDLRGGATWCAVQFLAPTDHVTVHDCTLQQFYNYGIAFTIYDTTPVTSVNTNAEVSACTIDKTWSAAMNMEAPFALYHGGASLPANNNVWFTPQTGAHPFIDDDGNGNGGGGPVQGAAPGGDGILFANSVDGAVVRGCVVRNMGHSGIANEIDPPLTSTSPPYYGTRNILVEQNTVTKGASSYCRAFSFAGSDTACTGVVIRRNYFYDLTNSSHLGGYRTLVYSNVFETVNLTQAVTPNLQPYHLDAMTKDAWRTEANPADPNNPFKRALTVFVMKECAIFNNTFVDADAIVMLDNTAVGPDSNKPLHTGNIFANNLLSSWRNAASYGHGNGFMMNSALESMTSVQLKNNGFWSTVAGTFAYGWLTPGTPQLTVAQLNTKPFATNNRGVDPLFVGVSGSPWLATDFLLGGSSTYLTAGLPVAQCLPAGMSPPVFVDYSGTPFYSVAPTTGAFEVPDVSAPVISGVTNGAYYSVASKTPTWTDVSTTTALLNGVAYTQGTAITAERQHTLVVTDVALNSATVVFTIDRTAPVVTGISNNGRYRDQTPIITFSDALTSVTATLDGDAFTSGNRVTDLGTHQLIVRDQANNTTTRNFTVYTVAP